MFLELHKIFPDAELVSTKRNGQQQAVKAGDDQATPYCYRHRDRTPVIPETPTVRYVAVGLSLGSMGGTGFEPVTSGM